MRACRGTGSFAIVWPHPNPFRALKLFVRWFLGSNVSICNAAVDADLVLRFRSENISLIDNELRLKFGSTFSLCIQPSQEFHALFARARARLRVCLYVYVCVCVFVCAPLLRMEPRWCVGALGALAVVRFLRHQLPPARGRSSLQCKVGLSTSCTALRISEDRLHRRRGEGSLASC